MTDSRSGEDSPPNASGSCNRESRLVGVVPMGAVPAVAADVISAHISGYLNLEAQIVPGLENPEYAFDPKRCQYDAGSIIQRLESMDFADYWKVLALMEADLFVPIFTFVFGEAKQGGKHALVSLFRLGKHTDGSTPPPSVVLERAAKVALHELGHLFNVLHCDDPRCLMHFTGGVEDLDGAPIYFCRYCSIYLKDAMAGRRPDSQGPSARPGRSHLSRS